MGVWACSCPPHSHTDDIITTITNPAGWQGSWAYKANGVLMVVTFFLCRVAALPWQVREMRRREISSLNTYHIKPSNNPPHVTCRPRQAKMVARHVGPLGRACHWLVSLQCLLSFALIVVLNSWWFLKMAQGLRRLLFREKVKGAAAPAKGGPAERRQKANEEAEEEGNDVSATATRSSKGRTRRQGKAA